MKNIPANLKNIFSLILLTSTIALFGCGEDASSKIDGKGGEFIKPPEKGEK